MKTQFDGGWEDLGLAPDVPDLQRRNSQVDYSVLNVLTLAPGGDMLTADHGHYDTLTEAQLAAAEFSTDAMWMIRENRIVEISGGLIAAITRQKIAEKDGRGRPAAA